MSALKNVSNSCALFKDEEDVNRMSGQSTGHQYHATEQQQQVLLSIQFCTVNCNWATWHRAAEDTQKTDDLTLGTWKPVSMAAGRLPKERSSTDVPQH